MLKQYRRTAGRVLSPEKQTPEAGFQADQHILLTTPGPTSSPSTNIEPVTVSLIAISAVGSFHSTLSAGSQACAMRIGRIPDDDLIAGAWETISRAHRGAQIKIRRRQAFTSIVQFQQQANCRRTPPFPQTG